MPPDGHKWKVTITDEGYLVGEILCPYRGDPPPDAKCSWYSNGDNATGCWVQDQYDDIGRECFKGSLAIPVMDINWWHEPEEGLYFGPAPDFN